jgi:murein L,D-transpeptidase YcbB/YkuD
VDGGTGSENAEGSLSCNLPAERRTLALMATATHHTKARLPPAATKPTSADRSTRVYWVAGLAGLGILLFAGIALAAKSKGGPTPGPPGPAPLPTSKPPSTPMQQAAAAMATAIAQNGYRKSDQGLYQAFQSAAGLTSDGFPGRNTMNALGVALQQLGMTLGQLKDGYTGQTAVVYAWLTTCSTGTGDQCYNGTDAPTFAEWNR